jgi:hypothetical protein
MGINHIQLSPALIAALYPDTLVTLGNPSRVFPFLGKNLRSISFLVHCPGEDFLPEEQLVFLQKMLSACRYTLDDIALVNTADLSPDFTEIRLQFQPRIIFLWGIQPATIGLKPGLPDFTITLQDGISVIPVPSPHLMIREKPEGIEMKHLLWACLKKLFTL